MKIYCNYKVFTNNLGNFIKVKNICSKLSAKIDLNKTDYHKKLVEFLNLKVLTNLQRIFFNLKSNNKHLVAKSIY